MKQPALTVNVRFDDKTEQVALARSGTEAVASRSDEPGSAKLAATALDEVLEALEAVK